MRMVRNMDLTSQEAAIERLLNVEAILELVAASGQ